MKTTASQTHGILAHLKSGGTLTAIQALEKFHCFRLAARIGELKAMGWQVRREIVRTGDGCRFAKYSLPQP